MKVQVIALFALLVSAGASAGAAGCDAEAGDYSASFRCGSGAAGDCAFLRRAGVPSQLFPVMPQPASPADAQFEFAGMSGGEANWKAGDCRWRGRLSKDGFVSELSAPGDFSVKLPVFAADGGGRSVLSCSGLRLEVRYRGWICIYETDGEFRDTGAFCCRRARCLRIFEAKGKKKMRLGITMFREGDLSALAPHPRLFATQEEFRLQKERLNGTAEGRKALERLLAKADSILAEPTLERVMVGRRLLNVSRKALARIGTLSFAWKMTLDRRYAVRAAAEARAVCAFSDWNPSHFLDVGEMALAVAIARDWLDDALSEDDKRLFSRSILTKALTNGDESVLSAGWLHAAWSNWNQVCNGGLAAGAAAVREDYPDVAEAMLRRVRATLPVAMASYADGNFPEGASYWQYATDYNCLALDVLERQFADGAADLFSIPGFAEQADYSNLMTGSTGMFFNFSDPYSSIMPARHPVAACWYLASRFNRLDALERFERPLFAKDPDAKRMTPFMLLWYRPGRNAELADAPSCRMAGGMNPIAVMRSGWRADDWYVGVKAGSPSVNHGHMDGGSFVLEHSSVRWAVDLPCENYNRIEQMKTISLWNLRQESSRWSLFRLNTEGHGTLTVDGAQQEVDGAAKIISCVEKPVPEVVVDMTGLYPAAKKVVRTFRLENGALSVRDELEGLKAGARVGWNMNTAASVSVAGRVLRLSAPGADGTVRSMKMTATENVANWECEDLSRPRTAADSPNEGVTRVRFTLCAPENGRLSFAVVFEGEGAK